MLTLPLGESRGTSGEGRCSLPSRNVEILRKSLFCFCPNYASSRPNDLTAIVFPENWIGQTRHAKVSIDDCRDSLACSDFYIPDRYFPTLGGRHRDCACYFMFSRHRRIHSGSSAPDRSRLGSTDGYSTYRPSHTILFGSQ